jgi:hypothetical protein
VVIVKYRTEPEQENAHMKEVLIVSAMERIFKEPLTSKNFNWKQVEYIQAVVKDPLGVGKSTAINWFSPLQESSPSDVINFEFQHLPNDLTLLTQQKYTEYMHKQLLKVCYYL